MHTLNKDEIKQKLDALELREGLDYSFELSHILDNEHVDIIMSRYAMTIVLGVKE